jgi:hypothetical protein
MAARRLYRTAIAPAQVPATSAVLIASASPPRLFYSEKLTVTFKSLGSPGTEVAVK